MLGCRGGKSIGWHGREPTIAEILSDSIVKAVMSADGVDAKTLERDLRSMALRLRHEQGRKAPD